MYKIKFIIIFPIILNIIYSFEQQQDPQEPLFLTPLIETNRIQEAQKLSKIHSKTLLNINSYSGYLTVNKNFNSNLFFWYFPSENNYKNDPLILWLQGGPGVSSLFGLFMENGPYKLLNDKTIKLRSNYRWTTNHSILYIDNPVGTGFSFTSDENGYSQNENDIGENLYIALMQFFKLFPTLIKNDFYIIGESYGGKYAPAIAYTIHKNNLNKTMKMNLKGIGIGNGLCDPVNQLKYSDYLYQLGLIDTQQQIQIFELEQKIINNINENKYLEAFYNMERLVMDEKDSLFRNFTDILQHYNYLFTDDPNNSDDLRKFLELSYVKRAIHVGERPFNNGNKVEEYLANDVMQSVAPWISELLNHYKVLFYNGQLDVIIAYPLTINFLKKLKYQGSDQYKIAKRHKWYVNKQLAGYIKEAGNLIEVLIRDAGHMAPADQPEWTLDLIHKFVRNLPLY